MIPRTLTYTSPIGESNDRSKTPREGIPPADCGQSRKQEGEERFEAGVQWFLAVSRAA